MPGSHFCGNRTELRTGLFVEEDLAAVPQIGDVRVYRRQIEDTLLGSKRHQENGALLSRDRILPGSLAAIDAGHRLHAIDGQRLIQPAFGEVIGRKQKLIPRAYQRDLALEMPPLQTSAIQQRVL